MTTETTGGRKRFTKRDEILDFLRDHPGWFLERCEGVRMYAWWWVRNSKATDQTIKCHANAAYSANKQLVFCGDKYKERWKLPKNPKTSA